MSTPTVTPRGKVTTVANISTSQRFAVERSSTGVKPPQTRPPIPPRPAPTVIPKDEQGIKGINKNPSELRNQLEQYAHRHHPNGPRSVPVHFGRPGAGTPGGDPPEGIGGGSVPPGGVKVK